MIIETTFSNTVVETTSKMGLQIFFHEKLSVRKTLKVLVVLAVFTLTNKSKGVHLFFLSLNRIWTTGLLQKYIPHFPYIQKVLHDMYARDWFLFALIFYFFKFKNIHIIMATFQKFLLQMTWSHSIKAIKISLVPVISKHNCKNIICGVLNTWCK